MKHFLFCLLSFVFVLCFCKTQQFTMHDAGCTVIRDSVSVTYKQGRVELDKELDYNTSGDSPSCVTAPLQHTSGQSPLCNRPSTTSPLCNRSPRSPSITQIPIRVDTVFIERWHTQTVPTPPPRGESVGATKFYKDCTKGFWVLLILFLGRIAFRIVKAIYRR